MIIFFLSSKGVRGVSGKISSAFSFLKILRNNMLQRCKISTIRHRKEGYAFHLWATFTIFEGILIKELQGKYEGASAINL